MALVPHIQQKEPPKACGQAHDQGLPRLERPSQASELCTLSVRQSKVVSSAMPVDWSSSALPCRSPEAVNERELPLLWF